MTTEGEQQEAVCGTCGKRAAYVGTGAFSEIALCRAHWLEPFIPAPVVHSDDRCAFPNSQWGTCGIPESAHADLMQPLVGSRFHHEYQRSTPPTPSQDAEGDGLARLFHEAYERLAPSFGYETRRESAVLWERVPEQNRALMVAVCREVESAIREPYEELVKAARSVYIAHHAAYGGCNYGCALCAAYAHIEESLGGRK